MHYNIQIHIQQVQEPEPGTGIMGQHTKGERKVTSVLELKVTADTEAGAYERALKVLSMNAPELVTGTNCDVTLEDRVARRPL